MAANENIKSFACSVLEGRATVFIGPGISQAIKLPGWNDLAKRFVVEIGNQINLKVDENFEKDFEQDPLRLAEYVQLSSDNGRNRLLNCLSDAFKEDLGAGSPEAISILSEMPITTLWTTNFDTVIERTYGARGRDLEALTVNQSLLKRPDGNRVLLHKMHGCIERFRKDGIDSIVITRSDYDRFALDHGGFQTRLQSDIISQHFLFIGFSFMDPNLHHILTLTAATMKDQESSHAARHTAILKRPSHKASDSARRKHELFLKFLQCSYGIDTIQVDDYDEVPEVLKVIRSYVFMDRILVSGSFPVDAVEDLGIEQQRKRVEELSVAVGRWIAEGRDVAEGLPRRPRTLVSGFGLTVGLKAIAGNSGYHYEHTTSDPRRYQEVRPFPLGIGEMKSPHAAPPQIVKEVATVALSQDQLFTSHRRHLIKGVGACIFIGGWKKTEDGVVVEAPGVEEEYNLVYEAGIIPLAIGSSGGMACRLWKRFKASPEYQTLFDKEDMKSHYEALGQESPRLTPKEVVGRLNEILQGLEEASFSKLRSQGAAPQTT